MADGAKTVYERLFGGSKPSDDAPATGGGADTGASDLAALKSQARKARGKPSKAEVALADAAQQAALDELFENENWEVMASMYFETRFAMTGFQYFRLTEKQERILGKSMGTCMRMLLQIDPQWVALIVFGVNFGTFVADKELTYRRVLKATEEQANAGKPAGSGWTQGKNHEGG